jgi:serine/threonine protein phosphatase PrpC
MTENPAAVPVEAASVTDRGLSEKRPQNEDSMLCDPERRIFAVADGVGGAQAGEVASQTAIEVLGEAFRHRASGEDAEDLMEIAIQRANDSIYRLSREQAQFAMMATTIVALHLDGLRATIGHVGDSRLYRLTPDGHLRRETEDHSLVEEEVRAGRMTPEQAANHPGRNVISRALGAEESVEVDMKTIEVENGSVFLLCSDGITRHIPDSELSTIIRHEPSLEDACEEMKRLCYERGAEDNLTAVLVRVGGAVSFPDDNDEVTLVRERDAFQNAPTLSEHTSPLLQRPFDGAVAAGGLVGGTGGGNVAQSNPLYSQSSKSRQRVSNSGGVMRGVGVLFLVLAAVALAFYVGMMFDRKAMKRIASVAATPTPAATTATTALEDPAQRFDRLKSAVDRSPTSEAIRMTAEANNQPLNSDDPEFLYLYGRAMLLTNRQQEAATAFDRAIQKINENMTPRNGELKIDAGVARVAAQLRGGDVAAARAAASELGEVIRSQQGEANSNANYASNSNANAQPSPSVSP